MMRGSSTRSVRLTVSLGVRIFLVIIIALTAAFALWRVIPTTAAPQSKARLQLQGPAQVDVGQPIEIVVRLLGANDVAGYETNVLFDTSVAHLRGLQQRENDVRKLGRDVQTLGPVFLENGVAFGAYSCPFAQCTDSQGTTKKSSGASGTVRLATFSIVAEQPGQLTITLDSTKFVDVFGNTVPVDLSGGSLTVQVRGES